MRPYLPELLNQCMQDSKCHINLLIYQSHYLQAYCLTMALSSQWVNIMLNYSLKLIKLFNPKRFMDNDLKCMVPYRNSYL